MQAAQAAIDAAEEFSRSNSFSAFVDSVDYGVSSELIDALAVLGGGGHDAEIRAEWSPSVPEPSNTPRRISVSPNHVPALKLASERFRLSTEVATVTVSGTIVGLDRAKYGEAGISRMNVVGGSAAKRLRVKLSREQYDEAIVAHSVGAIVRVTGEQVREGNLFWLYNVRDIQVVPESTSDRQEPIDRTPELPLGGFSSEAL
jgi:hypothetical protein